MLRAPGGKDDVNRPRVALFHGIESGSSAKAVPSADMVRVDPALRNEPCREKSKAALIKRAARLKSLLTPWTIITPPRATKDCSASRAAVDNAKESSPSSQAGKSSGALPAAPWLMLVKVVTR